MINLYFGTVSEVVDVKKFVVKVTVPTLIEDVVAYPMEATDELAKGDAVVLFGIESILGYSFIYQKIRLYDHTRLKMGDSIIDINDDGEGESKGEIKISSSTGSGPEIIIKKDSSIEAKVNGNSISIDKNGNCEISATSVTITGGTLNVNGTAAPTGSGPFCGIPNCLFTGAPHVGNKVTGT